MKKKILNKKMIFTMGIMIVLAVVCTLGFIFFHENRVHKENIETSVNLFNTEISKLGNNTRMDFQMSGIVKSTYNSSSSTECLTGIYLNDKSLGEIYSKLAITSLDGTEELYDFMSDGTTNICGESSGDALTTDSNDSDTTEESTETQNEASDESMTYSEYSDTDFEKATAYATTCPEIEQNNVTSCTMVKNDNDCTEYELTLKKDTTIASWLMESISYVDSDADITYDIDTLKIKMTLDTDNNLKSIKYTLDTDMTCEGETLSMDYTMSYLYTEMSDNALEGFPDLSTYVSEG